MIGRWLTKAANDWKVADEGSPMIGRWLTKAANDWKVADEGSQ